MGAKTGEGEKGGGEGKRGEDGPDRAVQEEGGDGR